MTTDFNLQPDGRGSDGQHDFNQRVALGYVKVSGVTGARNCKEAKFGSTVKIGDDNEFIAVF